MLHAILRNKAGRIEREGESLRWRDLFKGSEDLLTATFFGRLPHLSDGALGAVLRFLLGDNPLDPATFQRLELWPKLTSLQDRRYVEPDVLLHFGDALVVIEVKPSFGGDQYREQWLAQVNAVVSEAEFDDYEDRLYYVALGNIPVAPLSPPDLPERFIQMTLREWEPLRRYLQTASEFVEGCRQDRAIRDEWLQAFELFGMAPVVPEWAPLFAYAGQLDLDCGGMSERETPPPAEPTGWAALLDYAGTLHLSRPDFSFLNH
ncbi:hypothetical protein BFW41_22295 [Aeromonas hydrophila]|uniref:hypothetical protein n=1 Tax=Aeromonas TaxID=642 RepID=UPI000946F481|nr:MULTISPECIES: hypothetical protein [Aeromonas]AXV36529.1 hypothetical protein BFW41_22295 [Aeromonas hydrophila]EKP0311804.1 hypothetical protein [Aeromonas veronii]MBE8736771.1 hypothetical protein [Aeromonas veronii]MBE8740794.1 hypothetical protein [Aeromonas veronii]MBE8745415.1 hypothetical protein [Aeromonas veronii]